jgi:tight adherence protein C
MLLKERRQARLARERASSERAVGSGSRPEEVGSSESPAQKLGRKVSAGRTSQRLRERLAAAGFHSETAASTFLGYKLLLSIAAALGSTLLLLPLSMPVAAKPTIVALVTGILFLAPDVVVSLARRRRCREVRDHLPDAIDLLEICVSAGMGLDMAWNAVSDEMRRVNTTLADEMDLTNLELSLGVSRANAMRHMAQRTGADEISSLVALLVQSERFGASIVSALRTFAETMRDARSTRAEEAAEKTAVRMLFPMVLFIFPPLLIVMVGPALLKLVSTLNSR